MILTHQEHKANVDCFRAKLSIWLSDNIYSKNAIRVMNTMMLWESTIAIIQIEKAMKEISE